MNRNNYDAFLNSILLITHVFLIVVEITPIGPLYVPVNTQKNITCHVEGTVDRWGVILKNGTELSFRPSLNEDTSIPGITGRYVNGVFNTLLITVNTTETSVTGLSCFISVNLVLVQSTVNVTIYG